MAKELGWWTGIEGYYDDVAAKYRMLPGSAIQGQRDSFIFGAIQFERPEIYGGKYTKCGCAAGRKNCMCLSILGERDFAFIQTMVGLLIAAPDGAALEAGPYSS
jgi:hypothetical protein